MTKLLFLLGIGLGFGGMALGKNCALVIAPGNDFEFDRTQAVQGLTALGWRVTVIDEQNHANILSSNEDTPQGDNSVMSAKSYSDCEQVYIQISAHGSPKSPANYTFHVGPHSISDVDIETLVSKLRAKGKKVAVSISSCHSGEFNAELVKKIHASENDPPACLILSSVAGANSEACMPSDFNAEGQLINPRNRAFTSTAQFVARWLAESKNAVQRKSLSDDGNCYRLITEHYTQCMKRAENELKIKLSPHSSLKDAFRVGRLCDETINFPDTTGKLNASQEFLSMLAKGSEMDIYGTASVYGQLGTNTHELYRRDEHMARASKIGRRYITESVASPAYEDQLREKTRGLVQKYLALIHDQRSGVMAYRLAGRWMDEDENKRREVIELLGQKWVGQINKQLEDEFVSTQVGRGMSPRDVILPALESSFEKNESLYSSRGTPMGKTAKLYDINRVHRIRLLGMLQELAKMENDPKLEAAIRLLQGGELGSRLLASVRATELEAAELFKQILSIERKVYDETLGRIKGPCDDFQFSASAENSPALSKK